MIAWLDVFSVGCGSTTVPWPRISSGRFGEFVADGYRKNSKFLNFSCRNQAISPI